MCPRPPVPSGPVSVSPVLCRPARIRAIPACALFMPSIGKTWQAPTESLLAACA
jgi:hypothetical protein